MNEEIQKLLKIVEVVMTYKQDTREFELYYPKENKKEMFALKSDTNSLQHTGNTGQLKGEL